MFSFRPIVIQTLESRTLLSAGILDPGFADAGKLVLPVQNFVLLDAYPDGKILAAGSPYFPNPDVPMPTYQDALFRLTAQGTLDPSFGANGKRLLPAGTTGRPVLLADGKILRISTNNSYEHPEQSTMTVTRLNADGSDDLTFGTAGKVVSALPHSLTVYAAVRQGNQIYLAGHADAGRFGAIARIGIDGRLDTIYGQGGLTVVSYAPDNRSVAEFNALAIQGDGKAVAVGYTNLYKPGSFTQSFALARFTANGKLDETFGSGGRVQTSFPQPGQYDWGQSIIAQPDGKILAVGSTLVYPLPGRDGTYEFALARYNPDGSPDAGFGNGGRLILNVPGGSSNLPRGLTAPNDVQALLQPDGKIILGGSANILQIWDSSDFILLRLTPDGRLDPSFGSTGPGWTLTNVNAIDRLLDLEMLPDGRIIAGGLSNSNMPFPLGDMAILRYTNDIPPLDRITASIAGSTLRVYGTPGDDVITLTQSAGKTFVSGIANGFSSIAFSRVEIRGFAGNDRVDLSALTVAASVSGEDGNDTLIGSRAGDTLDGGNANDSIVGGDGNDLLLGGAGHDNLNGNNGNDTLDGGAGPDRLSGGSGIDSADYHTRTADLLLSIDNLANDGEKGEGDNLVVDLEVILSGGGNDSIVGGVQSETIFGGAGNDTIRGGAGNDYLNGGPGQDHLFGEDGNDQLLGADGQLDWLSGGAGFDRAKGDANDLRSEIESMLA